MDKKFRDKLEGFSAEPPAHVWNNIQGQLAARRKTRRLVFLRWVAAAAVVIFAFLSGWYFNEKSEKVIPARVENHVSPLKGIMPQAENITEKIQKEQISPYNNEATEISELAATAVTKMGKGVLVASDLNLATETRGDAQPESSGKTAFEKFEMSFLDRRTASFPGKQPEAPIVLKNQKEVSVDQLSETEKMMVAENAKLYSETSEKKGNWKMGLEVSPGYASQVTSHTDSYAQNMTYSGTEGNKNVGGGFSVQYKTGKKWSIESGIYYAQNGQRSSNEPKGDYYYSVAGPAFETEKSYFNTAVNLVDGQMAMNSTAGVIEFSETPRGAELASSVEDSYYGSNTLLTSSEFSQVFDFVEIPLYVRYDVIDAKIGVQVLGGLNAGIVAGNNVYMESGYGTQNVGKTQDISTLNLSGTIGFGLSYDLSNHISLAVEPRLNYYLNSINKNPDVVFRPYRIGVYTGLYYQF